MPDPDPAPIPRRPAVAAARGFTLVEALVVLLVASLAATALPRLLGAGQGGLLRAAAGEAAAALREARQAARASGRAERVVFDTALGTWSRGPGGGPSGRVPAGARLAVEGAAAEADGEGRVAIGFDAEGGSTGGRVRMALGRLSAGVEVEWMTGHVRALP